MTRHFLKRYQQYLPNSGILGCITSLWACHLTPANPLCPQFTTVTLLPTTLLCLWILPPVGNRNVPMPWQKFQTEQIWLYRVLSLKSCSNGVQVQGYKLYPEENWWAPPGGKASGFPSINLYICFLVFVAIRKVLAGEGPQGRWLQLSKLVLRRKICWDGWILNWGINLFLWHVLRRKQLGPVRPFGGEWSNCVTPVLLPLLLFHRKSQSSHFIVRIFNWNVS